MNPAGWQLQFPGQPWWLVLPLAALAVWGLLRLHRREYGVVPPAARRRLLLLRGAALGLLVLLFLEPTLTRHTRNQLLPTVAVVVDASGSMAVRDEMMPEPARVAEAVGLGLLPPAALTNAPDRAAVTNALAALAGRTRHERARQLVREKVLPALADRARVSVYALADDLQPLDPAAPAGLLPNRSTDFAQAFGELARATGQDYLGGVLLLSDGRQTTGLDPAPVIRGWRARGATFSGLLVGDPGAPPDAVVAELAAPDEVFRGENTPLSARYRVTGLGGLDWDLIVTENGRELARRPVRETTGWEYENFVFPATNAGVNVYRARLEPARDPAANRLLDLTGGATLELWRGLPGDRLAGFFDATAAATRRPDATAALTALQYAGRGNDYAARVRGFLIPPQSGDYTFWIASDDSSELWLSPAAEPDHLSLVASVPDYVPVGHWTDRPSQRSRPLTLRAGQPCYFEVRHKQGGGEDHLAVGWTLPDGTLERPVPGRRLTAFDDQSLRQLAERRAALALARTNTWKEASLANNAADTTVTVNDDVLKVLLLDSTPRWESRYLASLFERDRRVALTRRYHVITADDPGTPFLPPNQAAWNAFDMVCLGDVDPSELPPAQQRFLVDFVSRRGGFLVCLAGPRGLPQGFSLGPLADLLPVRVGAAAPKPGAPVRVALTRAGAEHPVTQVLDDPANNAQLWPLLPPLQWIAGGVVAKPATTVLLAARNPAQTPIVAFHRFGAGRVFWIGTEETWRWRDRLGDRIHQTFWLQAMRWGLAGRLRGQDPRLQTGLERSLVNPGDPVEVKARTATPDGANPGAAPTAQLELLDDQGRTLTNLVPHATWSAVAESPGLWHLELPSLPEGRWRLTLHHPDPALAATVQESREFLIRAQNNAEGLDLSGDLPALRRLADAGGGRAGTLDQTDAILRDFTARLHPRWEDQRTTLRLWNSYLTLLVIIGLLCTEWVLRKRHGLP